MSKVKKKQSNWLICPFRNVARTFSASINLLNFSSLNPYIKYVSSCHMQISDQKIRKTFPSNNFQLVEIFYSTSLHHCIRHHFFNMIIWFESKFNLVSKMFNRRPFQLFYDGATILWQGNNFMTGLMQGNENLHLVPEIFSFLYICGWSNESFCVKISSIKQIHTVRAHSKANEQSYSW